MSDAKHNRESDYVDLAAIRAEAKRLGLPPKILERLPREHATLFNRRVWGRSIVFAWLVDQAVGSAT